MERERGGTDRRKKRTEKDMMRTSKDFVSVMSFFFFFFFSSFVSPLLHCPSNSNLGGKPCSKDAEGRLLHIYVYFFLPEAAKWRGACKGKGKISGVSRPFVQLSILCLISLDTASSLSSSSSSSSSFSSLLLSSSWDDLQRGGHLSFGIS